MTPWPGAPKWMDEWDGVEPLAKFISRRGPKVSVLPMGFVLVEDETMPADRASPLASKSSRGQEVK